ncbi:diacylglycerol kinase catalytic domain protein, partial [Opisthorchis viverrini]
MDFHFSSITTTHISSRHSPSPLHRILYPTAGPRSVISNESFATFVASGWMTSWPYGVKVCLNLVAVTTKVPIDLEHNRMFTIVCSVCSPFSSVCEYYSHYECLDFASTDCKQCAVSTMTTALKVSFHMPSNAPLVDTFGFLLNVLYNGHPPFPFSFSNSSQPKSPTQLVPVSSPSTQARPFKSPTDDLLGQSTDSGDNSQPASAFQSPKSAFGPPFRGSPSSPAAQSSSLSTTGPISNESTLLSADAPDRHLLALTNRLATTCLTDDGASTGPEKTQPHFHHWREGNLPMTSKCAACRKTCWSTECLTGVRCEWCGITASGVSSTVFSLTQAHFSCQKNLPIECDFGVLREIMLPPACVSLPRTSLLVEQIIGMTRPPPETLMGVQSLTDEFSSSGDSPEESGMDRRSIKERSDFDDYVRVYDGMARYRKRQCRYLSLGRSVSVHKVIELSLKAFQLPPDEAKSYCLVELNERDGAEHVLVNTSSFKSQLQFETRRPQIILRVRERSVDREYIQVYPGAMGEQCDTELAPVSVPVTRETTSHDAIVLALRRFNLEHLDARKFHLVETILDRGLTERAMPAGERIWALLERVRRESVRACRLTRFYLQPVEDLTGPGVALFVGNLKKGLSQRLYERILLERLGVENRWDSIEVIYYDFGSLVLVYSNPERADEAYHILKQSTFEDRPILAMILPRLIAANLPNDVQPLLVLVNVKSGGCQGIELITSFRKLLNPHQVFNLDCGGPLPGLHCFRHLKRFKILVCGGDGTVGWALSCLDNVGQDAACPTPPMAILPIGTGNDLARVLRWGPGYTGGEEPLTILRDVVEAEKIRLDRWTVVIKPDEAEKDAQKKQLQIQANAANTNEDSSRIFVMNNYFGLGIDADLNLDFHMAREENPAKFNS